MMNAISSEYRYTKPELMSDVNGLYSNTEFVNFGLVLTGISDVYADEEKDCSFFYVDTLQRINNSNYKQCKAIVKVKGADLTPQEVYQAFIEGDILSFQEISSTKNKTNTAVFGD